MQEGNTKRKVLMSGGSGKIGSYFIRFASDRYQFRVADLEPWDEKKLGPLNGESLVVDLQDPEACRKACAGMDTVVHLAADASPDAGFMESLLANNVIATYNMYQAAHDTGCKRFIFASSVHAMMGYPADVQAKASMPVRPKDLYGVTKCFGEALGAYFAYEAGLPGIALRIGGYTLPEENKNISLDELDIFLNGDDFNDLLVRCIETPNITYAIINAISDNQFKRLDLTEARELLGYQPRVDAFALMGVNQRFSNTP